MLDADCERRTNDTYEQLQRENDESEAPYYLLVTTILLAILNVALIIIVIVGYCKFVARKDKAPVRNRFNQNVGMDLRETISEPQQQHRTLETLPEEDGDRVPPIVAVAPGPSPVPVKMRKRSMTFSETDEECRKYRENLTDFHHPNVRTFDESFPEDDKRSRKKSVVTFVGVE